MRTADKKTPAPRSERIALFVRRHERALLRIARQSSICAHDAHDAYQRALEIYIRKIETLDPATELAWVKVVVRHEAAAICHVRQQDLASEEVNFDDVAAAAESSVEELCEARERIDHSAEVMARLKRDELRALVLKAEGHSYREIGERLAWTYTKVNRCITEGRSRFRQVYDRIESGRECDRLRPLLTELIDGLASAKHLLELRPHLRHCGRCRAEIRASERLRARGLAVLPQLEFLLDAARSAKGRLRDVAAGCVNRIAGSDVHNAIGLAGGGGGVRAGSIAAIVGLCVAGGGAGTYCAVEGPLPNPAALWRASAKDDQSPRRVANEPPPSAPAEASRHQSAPPSPDRPAYGDNESGEPSADGDFSPESRAANAAPPTKSSPAVPSPTKSPPAPAPPKTGANEFLP